MDAIAVNHLNAVEEDRNLVVKASVAECTILYFEKSLIGVVVHCVRVCFC